MPSTSPTAAPPSWALELLQEVRELRGEVRELRQALQAKAQKDPEWVSTGEAASQVGVDRSTLDRLAPWAVQVIPEAVVQVGKGQRRKTYRWDRHRLPEAIQAARDAASEAAPQVTKGTTRRGLRRK